MLEQLSGQQAVSEQGGQAVAPFWIDAASDAEFSERNALAPTPMAAAAAESLRTKGVAHLGAIQAPEECAQVIDSAELFVSQKGGLSTSDIDDSNRQKRLVNFHLEDRLLRKMMLNERLLGVLDHVFGMRTSLYTSLLFKYGSQQPTHRDTPHFSTWPDSYFVGVWTALEDVRIDAGPLFYFEGAHRFSIDRFACLEAAKEQLPGADPKTIANLALELFNGKIIGEAPSHGKMSQAVIKAGDVLIWHAQLPHGGLPAKDLSRTRWSTVGHYAPEAIAVHQHVAFFAHREREQLSSWYEFNSENGRKYALAGGPAFM